MTRGQGGPEGGEEGGRTAGEVGGHLEHAAATLSDGFCDHDDLVHIGESSGDQHATRVTVAAESVRAEADRPGLDGLLDAVRDGLLLLQRQAVGVRPAAHVALVAALVAQHEGAHAAVADHRGQVDGVAQLVERLQVLGVGFPLDALDLPARPGVDGRGRDVLDALEQVDHKVAVLLAARGRADAAVAHDDRGDAAGARGREQRVCAGEFVRLLDDELLGTMHSPHMHWAS